jgi:outer membrane protein W
MRNLILILILFFGFLNPFIAKSQLKYTSVNYMISLPMGDTQDYIEKASFRGFGFETGKFINDNIAIGFGLAWNVFNENISNEFIQSGNLTISGKQFRYVNSFPIYINSSYYFSEEDAKIKAYAGLGIGTLSKIQRTDIGIYTFEDKQWHFALYPHAGVLFALGPDAHINLNARYHQAFAAGDSDAVQYLTINLGLHYIFF